MQVLCVDRGVLEQGKEHCGRQRERVTGFLNDLLNHIIPAGLPFLYTLGFEGQITFTCIHSADTFIPNVHLSVCGFPGSQSHDLSLELN